MTEKRDPMISVMVVQTEGGWQARRKKGRDVTARQTFDGPDDGDIPFGNNFVKALEFALVGTGYTVSHFGPDNAGPAITLDEEA